MVCSRGCACACGKSTSTDCARQSNSKSRAKYVPAGGAWWILCDHGGHDQSGWFRREPARWDQADQRPTRYGCETSGVNKNKARTVKSPWGERGWIWDNVEVGLMIKRTGICQEKGSGQAAQEALHQDGALNPTRSCRVVRPTPTNHGPQLHHRPLRPWSTDEQAQIARAGSVALY